MSTGCIQHAVRLTGCSQFTFWAVGIAEITTIVANQSSSPTSKHLLDALLKKGGQAYLPLTPLSAIGMIFIICGGLLRLVCYRTLKDFFTFEISIRKDHKLVTTGPYSVVRHPSYAGALLHNIGLVFWYGSRGSWLMESSVVETTVGSTLLCLYAFFYTMINISILIRMSEEDKLMKKSFGKEWEDWAQQVPYYIIPGIY